MTYGDLLGPQGHFSDLKPYFSIFVLTPPLTSTPLTSTQLSAERIGTAVRAAVRDGGRSVSGYMACSVVSNAADTLLAAVATASPASVAASEKTSSAVGTQEGTQEESRQPNEAAKDLPDTVAAGYECIYVCMYVYIYI